MFKNYKTEINPTYEQIQKINKTIGTCRFIYNFYIAYNKELYKKGQKIMTARLFSVWLNNDFLPNNPEYLWIKEVSSKSVKKAMENGYDAFRRFFKKQNQFPKFKKKNKSDVKMYFVKNNPSDCRCERHRINIPTLGWVKLKEKGYIPTSINGYIIKSGTVSYQAGKFFVSVIINMPDTKKQKLNAFGLGIDLGIKEFAVISNGTVFKNINKTSKLKKIEKQIKREQRCLSRKYKHLKERNKNMKGEATRQNIQKQILKVQKLYHKIERIRTDYINKCINKIVKAKPSYVTIEDLNVREMMKNKYLSRAIASLKFYEFRAKLEVKCKEMGIELRIVDKWYPSSKKCHRCGRIKKNLRLSDREYICECGYRANRDYNASLNLRDTTSYKIA